MMLEHYQKVEFEDNQITLDIPFPNGVTKDNEVWRIIPLSHPVVRIFIALIFSFEPGSPTPHAKLYAKIEGGGESGRS